MRTSKNEKNKKVKSDVIVEVDTTRLIRLIITVVMSVIFLLGVFFFIRSFLPVTKFEVKGEMTYKIYDDADFVSAAGLKRGIKLYSIDLDEAEKKILEECSYLENVTLKRKFPNTLVIEIEEKQNV